MMEREKLAGVMDDMYLRIDAVAAPRLPAKYTFFRWDPDDGEKARWFSLLHGASM